MINSVKSFLKVDQDHTSKESLFKPISYSVSKIGQASVWSSASETLTDMYTISYFRLRIPEFGHG